MKPLIVGIALIIVILIMLVFQIDNYDYRLQSNFLKFCADEASNSASLFYYENEFKNGLKIFNEADGIKSIEHVIQNYLKTDNGLTPLRESYWSDKITYTAYFFNDNLSCSVYKNGVKTDSFNFTYPYLYTDKELNYKKSVGKASVIVTINAGKINYRLSFIAKPICIRSSGYEYEI